ncbi:phage integrase family protein [Meridianimaribacter flavus]|uniref:Phage integrase family protein n=2 Tax=Meridianimaribacter flavus TaxID=571115 RepID=A0ABY2G9P0_9FLAO|nr:phage integrase family protein [Meridianimaribacter flavus]
MSVNSLLLRNVYANVYVSRMKANYSEPKIYTGGISIDTWSKLTRAEQKEALSKDWYVYYSFRHPKTLKLKRQNPIKGGANRFKTKRERITFLKQLQRNLSLMLQAGFSPYEYQPELENNFFGVTNPVEKEKNLKVVRNDVQPIEDGCTTINEAFELGLKLKEQVLAETSYPKFKSKINQFKRWLLDNDFKLSDDVRRITKKNVITYLNYVLTRTSSRNRNNSRTDLNSLFQLWVDNELIKENFILEINTLKSKPKLNKTYTPEVQELLFEYMSEKSPILELYVRFIYYNLLRPIEVCRLRIKDVDVINKRLTYKAKNKLVRTMIIPDALVELLPDLKTKSPEHWLFTPNKIGGFWITSDSERRNYFTKEFKKVKDHFKLGREYGLYSFRHTSITNLYREFRKTMTPFETKSKLMLITGHKTMDALEMYLRDIDAELPEDYSQYLK